MASIGTPKTNPANTTATTKTEAGMAATVVALGPRPGTATGWPGPSPFGAPKRSGGHRCRAEDRHTMASRPPTCQLGAKGDAPGHGDRRGTAQPDGGRARVPDRRTRGNGDTNSCPVEQLSTRRVHLEDRHHRRDDPSRHSDRARRDPVEPPTPPHHLPSGSQPDGRADHRAPNPCRTASWGTSWRMDASARWPHRPRPDATPCHVPCRRPERTGRAREEDADRRTDRWVTAGRGAGGAGRPVRRR